MNCNPDRTRGESGNILVVVVMLATVLAGLAASLFWVTSGSSRATTRHVLETNLLYVAESGLNVNGQLMAADPLFPVKDTTNFTVDPVEQRYVGTEQQLATQAGKQQPYLIGVQYLNAGVPVLFADRSNPIEPWDTARVVARSAIGGVERQVIGWYSVQLQQGFAAAILSDMIPTGPGSGGKSGAKDGHIVFDTDNQSQYVFGDLNANGEVMVGSSPYSAAVAAAELGAFSGQVSSNLAGTAQEIPDFTSAGSANQLFDFDRFQAAAAAGAGGVYTTIQDFVDAANDANNGAGDPLEGVIVLSIDSAAEGSSPKIEPGILPGGINVEGSLVFRFSNGTSPSYKVFIKVPLNVNAADLSGLDPADESTYASGYPGTFVDENNRAWNVNISPAFENFTSDDDLPALMFENGIVDIHDAANVSGVVYGPSFIEIENKNSQVQYFNGTVMGGAGVYLQASSPGMQLFRYDPNALNNLATSGNQGKSLTRVGFGILR